MWLTFDGGSGPLPRDVPRNDVDRGLRGCGAGLLLREIGAAVGERGRAVGIDVSNDQVSVARAYCADLAQVEARVEDLGAVAASEGPFDATVSVQVLE